MNDPTSAEWWKNQIQEKSMCWCHQTKIIGRIITLFDKYHYNFYQSSIELVEELNVDSKTEENLKYILEENLEPYQTKSDRKEAKEVLVETSEELASVYRKMNYK